MDFTITLTGIAPLLMHNSRLADPLDPYAKAVAEISKKHSKADADHVEMGRREWEGSLYYDSEVGPYVPGTNIERALLDAARLTAKGKTIERGLFVLTEHNPLQYNGPREVRALMDLVDFRHYASVKLTGKTRVMRCRPHFQNWQVSASGWFDTDQINPADLRGYAQKAGRLIGLGDWRPRFGRFEATVEFSDE